MWSIEIVVILMAIYVFYPGELEAGKFMTAVKSFGHKSKDISFVLFHAFIMINNT